MQYNKKTFGISDEIKQMLEHLKSRTSESWNQLFLKMISEYTKTDPIEDIKYRDEFVCDYKRYTLLQEQGFFCLICSTNLKLTLMEIDHVHPKSKGGSDDFGNLQVLCRDCNRAKKDKIM